VRWRSEAVWELQQAAGIAAPEDRYLQYRLAEALLRAGKSVEAVSALRSASHLEPYYAAVDLLLSALPFVR
jgi:Flp pilus assembly protein TadD